MRYSVFLKKTKLRTFMQFFRDNRGHSCNFCGIIATK